MPLVPDRTSPHDFRPHDFWQVVYPAGTFASGAGQAWRDLYPAALPDGRQIALPIRVLPGDGSAAVASLIVNQASFAVEDALCDAMAERAARFEPEVVIGVPTLGLPLANGVARRLGHDRMVALGTSRKFWYDDGLSEPMSSITSPAHAKRLFLDPRMLPLIERRRVVVVDDVISSGASIRAVLALLAKAGIAPVGIVAAMLQGERWRATLADFDPGVPAIVTAALASPRLARTKDGLWSQESEAFSDG
ncbi:phosphoribosyltransferase [Mesorhizobium sp. L-8-10]|uniref:phosphoribosyltransferase n=1 Tax=Mesorhizobium sp. L-8-10 TaxID=2744523 RepID=UPI001938C06B|nr:phosphoribosyltransferase [Mesorhizobium sp. L-8-10]BCH35469.1 phosphoribosyltransferase [Mesorhizobium sp. L-8-10]